jgi:hypothetical protein
MNFVKWLVDVDPWGQRYESSFSYPRVDLLPEFHPPLLRSGLKNLQSDIADIVICNNCGPACCFTCVQQCAFSFEGKNVGWRRRRNSVVSKFVDSILNFGENVLNEVEFCKLTRTALSLKITETNWASLELVSLFSPGRNIWLKGERKQQENGKIRVE